ncbi:low affinity immunoglobulin gamma Fc region receptor II-like isoform X3 [Sphaeramia orbicularis]|uniref:low affinity immunoglobulin gamma Fc region receptor II-like isoform X3 n=1 Tax=Sphaeramia orbicularis TaxID=375764 RepID=UPI00117FC202|nr:low affinity immunoglobulin gamma Fc region receptor II-like isoform X3 [Sphaeramia orbicularis]
MKNPSVLWGVCVLLLSGLTVSSVSVDVFPNRQQFFRGDSFTVSCADVQTDGWTVKRTLTNGNTETCAEFGRMDGSFCVVDGLTPGNSGVYWCETSSGQQSDQVSITVTDFSVILDIPALPVEKGSDVTLRCIDRGGSTLKAEFIKNSRTLTSVPVEEWTIPVDHLSDEDQYSCYVPLAGESPSSSLRVKVSTTSDPTTSSSDPGSSLGSGSLSGTTISVIIAVVSLVVLVLILVLLLWKKHKGDSDSSPPVDVTYADVTIAQAANRRDKHHGEAETVYAGIKTNTEGAEDVTYSHVVIKGQRSSRQNHAQSSDPDVVYSSVRPRNT